MNRIDNQPEELTNDSTVELIEVRLVVPKRYERWRLDHFIHARIPRLSRNRIQMMIRAQQSLGGESFRPASRVHGGQEIVLLRPAPEEPDVPRSFQEIYRDDHVIGINKPAGLPVHATARFHKNTLTAVLREQYDPGQVPIMAHRIDKETSGLMLLARTKPAEKALKHAFERRTVKKRYLAVVNGDPGPDGMIDSPIGPDIESGIRIKMGTNPGGQPARTRFTRLEQRNDYCLVEAFPETGRQHQIRVHLGSIGNSIVGDKLYGSDPTCLLEYLETGWTEELQKKLLLPRHALHAADLWFPHPENGEQKHLYCDMAKDMEAFWEGLLG